MFNFNVLKTHTCFTSKIKQIWINQLSVNQI